MPQFNTHIILFHSNSLRFSPVTNHTCLTERLFWGKRHLWLLCNPSEKSIFTGKLSRWKCVWCILCNFSTWNSIAIISNCITLMMKLFCITFYGCNWKLFSVASTLKIRKIPCHYSSVSPFPLISQNDVASKANATKLFPFHLPYVCIFLSWKNILRDSE